MGADTTDVGAPPPGELFSEANDNSVAILLAYGVARVLLTGDVEGALNCTPDDRKRQV